MLSAQKYTLSCSQNFLHSPRLVNELLCKSSITSEDVVYEIGPGKGIITKQLVARCQQVVAIELDAALLQVLRQRFAEIENLTLYHGDFLHFPLPSRPYKVFANIPFAMTTAIVTKLTSAPCPPLDAYLVMQKEAAHKFLGLPRESMYAVLLKPWFKLEIVHHFKRYDFAPAPHVDVVMVRLEKRGPPLLPACDRQMFRDFVVYGFTTRQPTTSSIFKGILTSRQLVQASRKLACDLAIPPSHLPFPYWMKLFDYFKQVGSPQSFQRISGCEKRLQQQQAKLQKIHRTRIVQRE